MNVPSIFYFMHGKRENLCTAKEKIKTGSFCKFSNDCSVRLLFKIFIRTITYFKLHGNIILTQSPITKTHNKSYKTMINPIPSNRTSINIPVQNSTPIKKKMTKHVCFSNSVRVIEIERIASHDANNVWYSYAALRRFKREAKEIMGLYRSIEATTARTKAERYYYVSQLLFFRGFEQCTRTRQRQKVLANKSVVYGQRLHMEADEIASIYTTINTYSTVVAFVQAIHDYVDVVNHNYLTIQSLPTILPVLPFSVPPSVHSILPPPLHPFGVQSYFALRKPHQQQQQCPGTRKRSRSNTRPTKASAASSSSSSLSSSTIAASEQQPSSASLRSVQQRLSSSPCIQILQ